MDRIWNFFFGSFRHFCGTMAVSFVLMIVFAPQVVQAGAFWVLRRFSYGVHQGILRPLIETKGLVEAVVQLGILIAIGMWGWRRLTGRR